MRSDLSPDGKVRLDVRQSCLGLDCGVTVEVNGQGSTETMREGPTAK